MCAATFAARPLMGSDAIRPVGPYSLDLDLDLDLPQSFNFLLLPQFQYFLHHLHCQPCTTQPYDHARENVQGVVDAQVEA